MSTDHPTPPEWIAPPPPWEAQAVGVDSPSHDVVAAVPPAAPAGIAGWRRRTVALAVVASMVGGALVAVVGGQLHGSRPTLDQAGQAGQAPPATGFTIPGAGSPFDPSTGTGGSGGDGGGTTTPSGTAATVASAINPGVVDVNTVLADHSGAGAGTGMILTAEGEILTNNHVVKGAATITATVVATGRTYTASVVGTAPAEDVAVLRLNDARGLTPIPLGDSTRVAIGQGVVAIGNARGAGGTPAVATGVVTALGQTMTASDTDGSNPETLHGLIQIDAPLQPGDSGGPLASTAGQVIGMNTAAGGGRFRSQNVGFAIPINHALDIARRISSGESSDTIHNGTPAFLGVAMAPGSTGGATLAGVEPGMPAATAGLTGGDTITAIGSDSVSTAEDLSALIKKHRPGDKVKVTWRTAQGQSRSATVTLIAGPAD